MDMSVAEIMISESVDGVLLQDMNEQVIDDVMASVCETSFIDIMIEPAENKGGLF